MKIKKLLKLQSVIEDSKIPADMTDNFKYWSRSKGDWISILDMDVIHVIRALNFESMIEVEKYKDESLHKIKSYLTSMEEENV